jgi:hypothetical protein
MLTADECSSTKVMSKHPYGQDDDPKQNTSACHHHEEFSQAIFFRQVFDRVRELPSLEEEEEARRIFDESVPPQWIHVVLHSGPTYG